jgi:hypothetical protein
VLDAAANEVRAFDEQGRYEATVVTAGRGPSEIVGPVGIEVTIGAAPETARPVPLLVVGTQSHVKLFSLSSDGMALERTLGPPEIPLPASICVNHAGIAIRGELAQGTGLVTVVDSVGRKRAVFGDGYTRGGPIAREELSRGSIACLPNGDVVIAFTYLPTITAYDPRGAVRWSVNLPRFVPLAFWEEQDAKGVGFSRSYESAGHRLLSFLAVGGDALLVQVAHLAAASPDRPNAQRIERRDTYLVSATTGQGALLTSSLPTILVASDRMLWGVDEAPEGHPVLVGYRY